ncbi:hypothetical protein EJ06DRAFT_579885 [Trichodelitschia bisporula]|uniref:Uncharacterized protein n=1 Tax=Trichodelitschia bisporula TaxID=703511 RepID=A0A6G1I6S0_9PEZI|nr:hypothetical protein EJ06DRAFT_579885 [Trichodelitschia bisporula]
MPWPLGWWYHSGLGVLTYQGVPQYEREFIDATLAKFPPDDSSQEEWKPIRRSLAVFDQVRGLSFFLKQWVVAQLAFAVGQPFNPESYTAQQLVSTLRRAVAEGKCDRISNEAQSVSKDFQAEESALLAQGHSHASKLSDPKGQNTQDNAHFILAFGNRGSIVHFPARPDPDEHHVEVPDIPRWDHLPSTDDPPTANHLPNANHEPEVPATWVPLIPVYAPPPRNFGQGPYGLSNATVPYASAQVPLPGHFSQGPYGIRSAPVLYRPTQAPLPGHSGQGPYGLSNAPVPYAPAQVPLPESFSQGPYYFGSVPVPYSLAQAPLPGHSSQNAYDLNSSSVQPFVQAPRPTYSSPYGPINVPVPPSVPASLPTHSSRNPPGARDTLPSLRSLDLPNVPDVELKPYL